MNINNKMITKFILVFIYAFVGMLWILFSDNILFYYVNDVKELSIYQSYKGWAYVILTAILLYWLFVWYEKIIDFAVKSKQQTEKKFSLLYEDAPNPYQSLDINGNIITINKKWLELLGYEKDELIGKWFGDMLAPKSLEHFKHNFPKFKANGTNEGVEFEMLHKNGNIVPVLFHGQISYDKNHKMIQTHCSFEDISSRYKIKHLNKVLQLIRDVNQSIVRIKNIQELLQESCNILTSSDLYNCAWIETTQSDPVQFYVSSKKQKGVELFKEKINSTWKPTCIELLTKENSDYIYVNDTNQCSISCPLKSDDTLKENAYILELIHNKSHYGCLTVATFNQYDQDELELLKEVAGDIAYAMFNIKLEQKLQQREERYRFVVEGSTDGVWDWNLITNKVYFSPRYKEILGYGKDELGDNFEDWKKYLHPDDKEKAFHDIKMSHTGQTNKYHNIHRLKHKNGDWIWVDSRAQTLFDKDGKAIRMIGSHTDITKVKEAEIELQISNEKFEKAFNYTPNIIIITNLKTGKIYDVNKTFETLFEYTKGELLGKTTFDIDLWSDFDDREKYIDTFHKYGCVDGDTYSFNTKTKKKITVNVYANLITVNNEDYILAVGEDITQKIALELENKKLIYVLDQNVNEVYIFDKENFYFEYINKAGLSALGYTLDEMKKMTPVDIVDDIKTLEDFHDTLAPLLSGRKKQLLFSVSQIRKDGSKYSVQSIVEIIEFNGIQQIVATVLDISNFKRIESAFYESEERFQSLMEQSPLVIELYDLDGLQINVNNAYEKLWDLPAQHTLYKFNLFESKEVEKTGLLEYIKKAYIGEIVNVPIYKFNPKGQTEAQGLGRERWLKTIIFPLKDTQNSIKNIVIMHDDVTEKQNYLEEIEKRKNELETIIHNAPNPIIVHNEDGNILIINQAWKDSSGFSLEEIPTINDWVEHIFDDKKRQMDIKKHIKQNYFLDEKVEEGVFTFFNKNRDEITWQFSSAPLGIINGKRTVITSAMDITELKNKDEMLMKQSRHAAMGEMIGMIAHQWRQPLSIISMDANNMLLDIDLNDFSISSSQEYAKSISKQVLHLSQTIDDFRNFFKPDKDSTEVNVKDILEQTLSIVNDSLKNNNIELQSSFETDKKVSAYSRELMQVFVNIITNAKDALVSHRDENRVITIRVYENEKYINTEICDNAGGIQSDILPKIFEPYFSTKDEKTGTGLGLYMSKMIIEEHLNGAIEVYNNKQGACFRVKLFQAGEKI